MKAWRSKVQALRAQDARLANVSDKALRALLEERPELLKYSPEQERDERGRWTSSGSDGEPTHGDIKAHMDSREGWTRTGPNRWTHENGSKVVLQADGRGKEYGGQVKTYSKDGSLSNMAFVAGDKATWMAGNNAKDATMERMVSTVENGGNEIRGTTNEPAGTGTPVSEGWQVGLSRSDGGAVTDHGEAQAAMRGLFPSASGSNWDAALGRMEHQGDGVWNVPLPQEHADTLQNDGYLNVASSTHGLEGEMP